MPGTVTVGCKLPNGLHLNVFAMDDGTENVMGGGVRAIKVARRIGRVTVRGNARRPDASPIEMIAGYGITPNVDADLWEAWVAANKDSELVAKGLVFAHAKPADTAAHARDGERVKSGLERIDPTDLPPEFKRKIETAKVEV